MADPPRSPAPDRGPTPGTPRWVKVTGVLVAVLVLLVVAMLLLPGGHGGNHGPARHGLSGDRGAPVSLTGTRA